MTRDSVPKIVVGEKVKVAVSVVGIIATCAATYYASTTGNWEPLSAVTMVMALIILFVTSEASA